jgi:hypothetical protein
MLRAIAAASLALGTAPALAGEPAVCADRAVVVQRLAQQFAEHRVAMGLASNGNVIEIFNNGASATWTIVMTLPNGQACLMAAGENWEPVAPPTSAEGPDA